MGQPSSGIRLGCQRGIRLNLLHPDGKLGRDIAIMRTEIEELHAKLARMPAVIARAALGIIFSTAIITTLLGGGSWHADGTLGCGCLRCRGRACIGALSALDRDYNPIIGPRVSAAPEDISADGAAHRRGADHNRSSNANAT